MQEIDPKEDEMALTTNPTTAITEALGEHPGTTAADLAATVGIGRSTANKCLAALEREGIAQRVAGGREAGRRAADRWSLVGTETVPATTGTAEPDAADDRDADDRGTDSGDTGEAAPSDRLGKGALGTLVLDYLAANPGEHGPVAVAKALGGKSSGAVGNALARLEATGQVRLTSAKPRRYEATR